MRTLSHCIADPPSDRQRKQQVHQPAICVKVISPAFGTVERKNRRGRKIHIPDPLLFFSHFRWSGAVRANKGGRQSSLSGAVSFVLALLGRTKFRIWSFDTCIFNKRCVDDFAIDPYDTHLAVATLVFPVPCLLQHPFFQRL